MPNYLNKEEIIKILAKFKQYKVEKTPYLNNLVGEIENIKILAFDFDDNQEEYQYNLEIKVSNFKDRWILNNFHDLIELLGYQSNMMQKDLVIKNAVGLEYILEWNEQKHFLTIDDKYFTFETKITTQNKVDFENLDEPKLFKQDTNELLRIAFLDNIINIISEEEIVSQEVQNILLNIKQIKKYHFQKNASPYEGSLDEYQSKSFHTVLSQNPLVVIKGPPGTGKSRLITSLLKHFVFIEKKPVVIAAQTHAALDNIIENISATSLKNDSYSGIIFQKSSRGKNNHHFNNWKQMLKRNIYQQLDFHSEANSAVKKLLTSTHTLRHSLNRFIPNFISHIPFSTFFSTIASANFEFFCQKNPKFKKAILIIDEVSKLSIIDVLRFAQYAQKVILVGDDKQLPPIPDQSAITNSFIKTLDLSEQKTFTYLFYDSIFEKIFDEKFKDALILRKCYRSSEEIVSLYNDLAYQGQIIPAGNATFFEFQPESLLKDNLLTTYQANNLIFFNHQNELAGYINLGEIAFLNNHLDWLNKKLLNKELHSLMIIFAYKKSYIYFKDNFRTKIKKIRSLYKKVAIGTVDMMQGQEADLVIFLSGYNKDYNQYRNSANITYTNILQNLQRINVMLSRTKGKLIIFGNKALMAKIDFWNSITKERTDKTWKPILNKFCQINIKNE